VILTVNNCKNLPVISSPLSLLSAKRKCFFIQLCSGAYLKTSEEQQGSVRRRKCKIKKRSKE